MPKKGITTPHAPAAIGPYSQGVAVEAKQLIFISGQIALDPATGELKSKTIAEQTRQSLENVKAVLAAAGVTLDAVVKVTVFLQNIADFAEMNEVYQLYFSGVFPARAVIEAAALPKGALVEIDAIAVKDNRQHGG